MIIDFHTHITFERFPEFSTHFGRQRFTADTLVKRMDDEGIDKSVVLPLSNPAHSRQEGYSQSQRLLD